MKNDINKFFQKTGKCYVFQIYLFRFDESICNAGFFSKALCDLDVHYITYNSLCFFCSKDPGVHLWKYNKYCKTRSNIKERTETKSIWRKFLSIRAFNILVLHWYWKAILNKIKKVLLSSNKLFDCPLKFNVFRVYLDIT